MVTPDTGFPLLHEKAGTDLNGPGEGRAPPAGLEPAAKRLEGACSIH